MGAKLTDETVALMKGALNNPQDDIAKAFAQSSSATTGLTAYDLEGPAKTIFPVLTPLRNEIPRVSGKGGIQANWRAVTGINVNQLAAGVSQGNRGGIISTTTAEYMAAYRGIGLEDYVTFEAEMAAEGYDDVRMRATDGLLRSLMIQEEFILFGGNSSMALGTTPTPSLTASSSGGTLATQTLSVIVVALNFDAYWALAGANNGSTGQALNVATAIVPASVTRTNADGTTDTYGGGSARKSANATVSVTGPSGSVAATLAAVNGAYGYAWFWGAAGSEALGAVTTINSVSITANATGTQTAASLPAADNSTNSLIFDGMATQILKPGSGSYVKTLATGTAGTGTPLTSNGAGGITEIDDACQWFWNMYRLSPNRIYVNAREVQKISKLVIANGGAPLIRLNADAINRGSIAAGVRVGTVLNVITNDDMDLVVHPNCPPGTVMFYTKDLPYKLSGILNILQVRARRDYYQIEWPLRTRKYEYGVYADEVLQNYFPPAFGIINNIGA